MESRQQSVASQLWAVARFNISARENAPKPRSPSSRIVGQKVGHDCRAPRFRGLTTSATNLRLAPISTSATRLTQRVPWLCVPTLRWVCLFRSSLATTAVLHLLFIKADSVLSMACKSASGRVRIKHVSHRGVPGGFQGVARMSPSDLG